MIKTKRQVLIPDSYNVMVDGNGCLVPIDPSKPVRIVSMIPQYVEDRKKFPMLIRPSKVGVKLEKLLEQARLIAFVQEHDLTVYPSQVLKRWHVISDRPEYVKRWHISQGKTWIAAVTKAKRIIENSALKKRDAAHYKKISEKGVTARKQKGKR